MTKKTIEEYRKEVDARPFETHNQYRNRVGTVKRYAALTANKPKWWERKEETARYKEAAERVEAKHAAKVQALRKAEEGSFHKKQIMYDFLRGAYGKYDQDDIPPWITGVYLSMHGIEEGEEE